MLLDPLPINESIYLAWDNYRIAIKDFDTNKAFHIVQDLLDEANAFLNTSEPWKKAGLEK